MIITYKLHLIIFLDIIQRTGKILTDALNSNWKKISSNFIKSSLSHVEMIPNEYGFWSKFKFSNLSIFSRKSLCIHIAFPLLSGVDLDTSITLTRDSYVYYFDPFYEMANETYTNLSITFRTLELSGLLFWNGQVRYALVYIFYFRFLFQPS